MRSAEMAPVSPPRMLQSWTVVSLREPLAHPVARSMASSAGSARSPAEFQSSHYAKQVRGTV